jgi:hypothetical protein
LDALAHAFEAVQGHYDQRPLSIVIEHAEAALAHEVHNRAAVSALGARAHARALLGDIVGANADLDRQSRVTELLPANVVEDEKTLWGWPITRVLHSRSLVHTYTGSPEASRSQQETINVYPAHMYRQVAQVQLQRAYTAVRMGDIGGGLEHAAQTLNALSVADRTQYVLTAGAAVLRVVPEVERRRSAVIEYREQLALPAEGSA